MNAIQALSQLSYAPLHLHQFTIFRFICKEDIHFLLQNFTVKKKSIYATLSIKVCTADSMEAIRCRDFSFWSVTE